MAVVLLTQESIDVRELQRMCGRFSSHVQIVYGTPIYAISFLHKRNLLHFHSACVRAQLFDAYAVYMIPYPSWTWPKSGRFMDSTQQQHAWTLLMVTALETNFFFYESKMRIPQIVPIMRSLSHESLCRADGDERPQQHGQSDHAQ